VKVYNKSKKIRSKRLAEVNDGSMRSRGDKRSEVTNKGKGNKKKVTKN